MSQVAMPKNDTLAALLSVHHVILQLPVPNKDALLAELARRASAPTGMPTASLRAALVAREALGSTGFGAGIAVPHARIDGLENPCGLFARLARPVAYDAIDGKPVDLVFMLLTPSAGDGTHLALLAAISRRLRQPITAEALRRATTQAQALQILLGS